MATRSPAEARKTTTACADPIGFQGVDFIELYVGNARQAAHYYCSTFGFSPVGYAGLECGVRDRTSIVLQQGEARFVLTSANSADHPVSDYVRAHGDGVKDVAFRVSDAEQAFEYAVGRGAVPIVAPTTIEDESGRMVRAAIAGPGDVVHSLVERAHSGARWPGHMAPPAARPAAPAMFEAIDHVAFSVIRGTLDRCAEFYRTCLGFEETFQEDTATADSGMRSKVLQSAEGSIRFPLLEPADGRRKSQIEEYLEYHGGSGVQHAALLTASIIAAVRQLRANGIEFLKPPMTYYEMLDARVGALDEDLRALRELSILADRDEWGYLLQIFSKPVQCRPTLFLEVIQRKEARGFGAGNVRALFQAVELEQARRGNL